MGLGEDGCHSTEEKGKKLLQRAEAGSLTSNALRPLQWLHVTRFSLEHQESTLSQQEKYKSSADRGSCIHPKVTLSGTRVGNWEWQMDCGGLNSCNIRA